MKKFRRIAAAAVAAVMVFSLAACGSKDSGVVADTVKELEKIAEEEEEEVTLIGKWESDKINMIDSFAEGADEELKEQLGSDISIKDYITAFNLRCYLTFNEDDTFELTYQLDTDTDQLRSEFAGYMRAIFDELNGSPMSDEELEQMIGMPIEDYAAETWSDETLADAFPENSFTGTYTNEDGNVTITSEDTGEFSSGKLEGGVLTLEDKTLGNIVFTKMD